VKTANELALTLCSTSRFRAEVLRSVGIEFAIAKPDFEERAVPGLSAAKTAQLFAESKARSVEVPGLRIGCDQTLELEGRILRKPQSEQEMHAQLASLAGRTHWLHSAVSVTDGLATTTLCESVQLGMRDLTEAMIARYLHLDEPVGAVGAYLYEKHGRLLFETVVGSDDTAIIGLPLVPLLRILRGFGFDPLLDLGELG
jgi:septum formation protein